MQDEGYSGVYGILRLEEGGIPVLHEARGRVKRLKGPRHDGERIRKATQQKRRGTEATDDTQEQKDTEGRILDTFDERRA